MQHCYVPSILEEIIIEAIHIIEGIALRFSIIISALTSVIAFTMPGRMMLLFTTDQELISIGASYLQIMGITYLCWSITGDILWYFYLLT